MSFSYTGNPDDSQIDACRFLIGDTDESQPIMQDEEIEYLINKFGSNQNKLNYNLFLQASTLFARAIKRSLGPQTEDPTSRLDYYKEQMEYYKAQCAAGALPTVKYAYPKIFRKGMDSNPPWPIGDKYVR